jgi:uncharacterized protein involved in outer membrane biogenesis
LDLFVSLLAAAHGCLMRFSSMPLIDKTENPSAARDSALPETDSSHRHVPAWNWTRWSGIILVSLLAACLAALYFLDWNLLRGPIGRYASARAGREIRIDGNLKVNLFRWQPHVEIGRLYVGNPSWVGARPQAALVKQAVVEFRLIPAIFGHWKLPVVELDTPDVLVVRDQAGRSNWDSGAKGASAGWHIPPINRFLVKNGHLEVDDQVRKLKFLGAVSSQEYAGGGGSAFELKGDGTLNAYRFSADVQGGPLINVDESKPYAFAADIMAGDTHAVLKGSILHPFHLDRFNADISFTGNNLSDLYYLTGLAMPRTPPYRISGALTRELALYRLQGLTGQLGNSDLQGELSVDAGGSKPLLRGNLTSRAVDFTDLGAVIGGGKYNPGAGLLPDTVLHTERLNQMDADVVYAADAIKSRDFPLRGLSTHIVLKDGVLELKPLSFAFSQGKLSGALKIDAHHDEPITSVDARITDIHVESFIKNAEKPVSGVVEARAQLTGRGNSVHKAASTASGTLTVAVPSGRIRHSLAEWMGVNLLNALSLSISGDTGDTGLRCALVHFSAHDGVLVSRQFVFDTDPVLVEGNGSINMKDETMDIRVQGKPKQFQLFRLRAPISISGRWDSPALGVDAKPILAQGAVGAGLGVLNPLAAIFAFLDPGLAKNADCSGLISTARQEGAPVKSKS